MKKRITDKEALAGLEAMATMTKLYTGHASTRRFKCFAWRIVIPQHPNGRHFRNDLTAAIRARRKEQENKK